MGYRVLADENVEQATINYLRKLGHDVELLQWCADETVVLLTNNVKNFEPLHRTYDHAGMLLYYDQKLPDNDPEGLARTVAEVFNQYGSTGIENELADLEEWYDWLHE